MKGVFMRGLLGLSGQHELFERFYSFRRIERERKAKRVRTIDHSGLSPCVCEPLRELYAMGSCATFAADVS